MCGFIGTHGLNGEQTPIPVGGLESALLGVRGPDEVAEFGHRETRLRFHRLRLVAAHRSLAELRFPSGVPFSLLNGTLHDHRQWAPDAESDHEALGIAFNTDGERCWEIFNGGFAACVRHRSGLVLATDAWGEKSVCWAMAGSTLWFSTSALLLARHLHRRPRTDVAVLDHLIIRGQRLGATYFADIHQLPPGHLLAASPSGIEIKSWRHASNRVRSRSATEFSADALRTALASRMTDGVAGMSLSGGVDSSILTVVGHRHANLRTCASVAPGDEQDLATDHRFAHALTATLPGMRHIDATASSTPERPRDFPVLDQDEHGLDAIAVALHTEGCNLLVSGDGADELFCGYDRIFRFALGLDHDAVPSRLAGQHLFARYAYADAGLLADQFGEAGKRWLRRNHAYLRALTWGESSTFGRSRTWFLRHHLFWLLRKLDFVAGSHGMEARTPFLHSRVTRFAEALSAAQLLPTGTATPTPMAVKKPLKDLLGELVPTEILARPKLPFPSRSEAVAESYLHALRGDPRPAVPRPLHDKILSGQTGGESRVLYLSYLNWLQSCANVLT